MVLSTENKHVKQELDKADDELKETRTCMKDLNNNLVSMQKKVNESNDSETRLKEKVRSCL